MPLFLLLGAMGLLWAATHQKGPQTYELIVPAPTAPTPTSLLAPGPPRTEIAGGAGGAEPVAQVRVAVMARGDAPRPSVDSGICSWALTSAGPVTLRQLIAQYAGVPTVVTCLSQRLAYLEALGP